MIDRETWKAVVGEVSTAIKTALDSQRVTPLDEITAGVMALHPEITERDACLLRKTIPGIARYLLEPH